MSMSPKLPNATARPRASPITMPIAVIRVMSSHIHNFTRSLLGPRWRPPPAHPAQYRPQQDDQPRRVRDDHHPGSRLPGGAPVIGSETSGEGGGVAAPVGVVGADELTSGLPPGLLVGHDLTSSRGPPAGASPGTSARSATSRSTRRGPTSPATAVLTWRAISATGTPHRPRTEISTWSEATRIPASWRPGR